MALLAAFAGLALLLALAGVYGVLAYSIARRTPEFGIRVALGAEHRAVLWLVFAQGMRPVVAGTLLGLAATILLSRLMANLLFNVRPYDPLTYAIVVASLVAVAALACYVPARRVLGVDPAVALRIE
jgi:ABC-type antimicrobial peptide transport system permease subunit